MQVTVRRLPQPAPAPAERFGPFRLVHPEHVSALTQEQRLERAKQLARRADVVNLLIRRECAAETRRFTGESITGFGALA